MTGTTSLPPRPSSGFAHETLFYRDDTDFLAGVVPFVRDGLAEDAAVVVVEPRPRIDLLRDALGPDADAVRFLDMTEVGLNPARIIPLWTAAVTEHVSGGRPLRGVGEPAYPGRRAEEFAECQVHEALLNHTFDPGPAWRLLCPYDETRLPGHVREGALRTHRTWSGHGTGGVSEHFAEAVDGLDLATLDACGPLAPPTDVVLRGEFGPRDVPAVRRTVRQYARSCGLPADRVEALELAASELASNSIHHGGGSGSLAMWREPDAAILEFTDGGRIADPLIGRRQPEPGQDGGMGLYLVNQLCDLVQVRTGGTGTVVRVSTWL
jgi:anti-sigma regulatory factor (Ser/Thr protein kinase)